MGQRITKCSFRFDPTKSVWSDFLSLKIGKNVSWADNEKPKNASHGQIIKVVGLVS